jgi:hypothetical protein
MWTPDEQKPPGGGYTGGMEPWLLSLVLKPFIALLVFGFICLPARFAVQRWMRDGKIKRALLRPLGNTKKAHSRQEALARRSA